MNTKTLPSRNSINCLQLELIFLLMALVFASFAVSPIALAVDPPPGGGYPNENTALGDNALFNLPTPYPDGNTALGFDALYNSTAYQNTAVGDSSMFSDTTGSYNTSLGWYSLYSNTTGQGNVAVGYFTMIMNSTGQNNVAIGVGALDYNTTGFGNVAIGPSAGGGGDDNVAIGDRAMASTNEGSFNTAVGYGAMDYCTGSYNVAVGQVAGVKLTNGSHNIDIGSEGETDDNRTIRIGNLKTQRKAYFAAVNGVTIPDGVSVIINSSGQLGTVTSSARYKDAIKPMDKASEAILALKPVTFRYKHELDPKGIPQFGLVAEDVEKVNPDLVARDTDGKPYTVRYEAVNAMLLNEFLKEHRKVEQQSKDFEEAIARQQKQIEALTAGLQKVSAQLAVSKSAPQTVLNDQ